MTLRRPLWMRELDVSDAAPHSCSLGLGCIIHSAALSLQAPIASSEEMHVLPQWLVPAFRLRPHRHGGIRVAVAECQLRVYTPQCSHVGGKCAQVCEAIKPFSTPVSKTLLRLTTTAASLFRSSLCNICSITVQGGHSQSVTCDGSAMIFSIVDVARYHATLSTGRANNNENKKIEVTFHHFIGTE